MLPDWEPLLDDGRVGKIADLLFLAYPDLPRDSDVFTFIVPQQTVVRDDEPYVIPAQAVFAVKSPNPRTWDAIYLGKEILSTAGLWLATWEREEKDRAHYVSTIEDPAFSAFRALAKTHVGKLRNLKELI